MSLGTLVIYWTRFWLKNLTFRVVNCVKNAPKLICSRWLKKSARSETVGIHLRIFTYDRVVHKLFFSSQNFRIFKISRILTFRKYLRLWLLRQVNPDGNHSTHWYIEKSKKSRTLNENVCLWNILDLSSHVMKPVTTAKSAFTF